MQLIYFPSTHKGEKFFDIKLQMKNFILYRYKNE